MKFDKEILFKLAFPLIIILGVAKTTAYYHQFKIPIIEYLTLTEITIFFLSNINVFIAFLMYAGVIYLIDNNNFRASSTLVFIGVMLITAYFFFSRSFRFDIGQSFSTLGWLLLGLFLPLLISFKSVGRYIGSLTKIQINNIGIIYYTFLILVFSSMQGYYEAKIVKDKDIYSGSTIKLKEDRIIMSTDSIMYIGKTSNYLFFYNKKENSSEIYPINEIEKITYKTKVLY